MTIADKILKWFDVAGRKDLPWQKNPTLYRVWVSEIMLQQTQVSTVIPYYERFMQKFPELSDLAKAPLDQVLKEWTGLGYYARARNLHKTATIIQEQYQGKFPQQFEILLQLPGIGRSTAGAILALASNQIYPILDGNVKRVLSRLFMLAGSTMEVKTQEKLWQYSEKLTPQKRVNHYTQAIMDLGATLCTRSKPNCGSCPLKTDCLAYAKNKVHEYPMKRISKDKPEKKIKLFILMHPEKQAVLLEKRPATGIWGGLWSFPEGKTLKEANQDLNKNLNIRLQSKKTLPSFRHTFTHFHLQIQPILCKTKIQKKAVGLNQSQNQNQRQRQRLNSQAKALVKKQTRSQNGLEKQNKKQYYWHSLKTPLKKGVATPIKRLLEQMK